MEQLVDFALAVLNILVGLAGALLIPSTLALTLRAVFRNMPKARDSFVGQGRWLGFSKRFGFSYALSASAAGYLWLILAMRFVPDTNLGALLLFGPSLSLAMLGLLLAWLAVLRWSVDET